MAMHFLRFQERYESPNRKFRNHDFTIIDFMEWYAAQHDGVFTYPTDWSGFNVPGHIVEDIRGSKIPDPNRYDVAMLDATDRIRKVDGARYYVIGSVGRGSTFEHEVAHGLFYTRPEYAREARQLVADLPKPQLRRFQKWLLSVGYGRSVLIDETQAYMTTGLVGPARSLERHRRPFIDLFRRYR